MYSTQISFDSDSTRVIRALLIISALIFILSSAVYNEFLLGLVGGQERLSQVTIKKIGITRLYFLVPGMLLLLLSEGVRRISWLKAVAKKMLVAKILLALFFIIQPICMLECALDPFIPKSKDAIFTEDSELGWKLRPNAENRWGGKWIKINSKGLRGPELDYAKNPNAIRILYLGDSVTFGWGVERHKDTFPYQIEAVLENDLGRDIETINSGVGGYATSQEYLYLSREGIKYNPDLVVLAFILNDVRDEFALTQPRGSRFSLQLRSARFSTRKGLIRGSSIMYAARKLAGRIRFGKNIQEGAKQKEVVNVRSLVFRPDDPDVNKAWNITLENVGKIFDFCKDHRLPVILVVFPFTFQFDNVDAMSVPQRRIIQFASNRQIPSLDLLPALAERLKEEQMIPANYFLDADHLTPLGANHVAEIISKFIRQQGMLHSLD
ncbi:MAG: hypothetical protein GY845_06565 [Planctomycetes bacterium]|nr:hypothetical protein [Planctomycetota bacterium]